ncbi:UDP-N-acetylmuramate dehydrogenase [Jongsikchunia kroppenstedtii]|uniref:UDP-N-acetylmuramate dehydrogenase n=1 Tax=Jongsikchunia kroppenstedtii TaxID=1121721 RepID=UPI0004764277|nr:UDP-N-acetylmuramate dehydrogenase [Jongsikchunia kroppenstedtii]
MSQSLILSAFTTFRLGGPARAVIRCTDADELIGVVRRLDESGEPVLLIGGGSNLVVADEGFDGTAVIIADDAMNFAVDPDADGRPYVTVGAGVPWDRVVSTACERGLGGLECLSGIPGAAGATPVQNVGAYGVEVGTLLRSVQIMDRATGTVRWVDPADLELGYRTSRLKHHDAELVVAVSLWLSTDGLSEPIRYRELAGALGADEGARLPTAQVREQVLALRRSKGMVLDPADHDTWSAGSFFTNPIVGADRLPDVLARIAERVGDVPVPQYPVAPGSDRTDAVKLSAGWLIERAGFAKGYPGPSAPARLSTKHTLALTNRGAARTADLLALAREVRNGVADAFDVTLEPEPILVGCTL